MYKSLLSLKDAVENLMEQWEDETGKNSFIAMRANLEQEEIIYMLDILKKLPDETMAKAIKLIFTYNVPISCFKKFVDDEIRKALP